jgi:5-methylcytosine-specific restriction endonuclease McrA
MARPAQYATTKTSDFHALDLVWLRRKGARKPGWTGTITWSSAGRKTGSVGCTLESSGLRLQYRHTPGGSTQPITVDELIPIVTTPMHFDGWRHWFACPSCHRRYRIIYGGARFRCRLCYGAKQFAISAGQ